MNKFRICSCCNTQNLQDRYFCLACGSFLRKNELTSEDKVNDTEWKIKRIVNNLSNVPHKDVFWQKNVDQYCRKIERLQALFTVSDEPIESYKKLTDEMQNFLDLCKNPEYQIAFVGTIKTGKSTLINALLGKNYASMAVTPETAALTKFRKSQKDYVKVEFYSDAEWKKLWNSMTSAADTFRKEYKQLEGDKHKDKWINHKTMCIELASDEVHNELSRWSSSQSPEHYFVKEIEVGISTLPNNFPPEVVFVDTPGLFDPVAYRSEITRAYIRKANAVFVCIDAQRIQKQEIETIASVFSFSSYNKNKVHIIATHWDSMNEPVNDWKKQKDFLKRQLVGKAFYDTAADAENCIMHSAAFIYNLCRDYNELSQKEKKLLISFTLKMKEDYDIGSPIDEYMKEIIEMTNIDYIRNIINNRLVSKYSQYMLQDITVKYNDILNNIRRYSENSISDTNKIIKASNANLESLKKQLEQSNADYDKLIKSREMLVAALKAVKKQTDTRLQDILKYLDNIHG